MFHRNINILPDLTASHLRRLSRNRNSSVGIVTKYGTVLQKGRSSCPCRGENLIFSTCSREGLRSIQLPTQWVTVANSLEVKQAGRKANHLPTNKFLGKNIMGSLNICSFVCQCNTFTS
jgi:hypothetical protein